MHICQKNRKKACIAAVVLIVGLVSAIKCPWAKGHLNNAWQKVKQLNPVK